MQRKKQKETSEDGVGCNVFCVTNNNCARAENPHADGSAEWDVKYNHGAERCRSVSRPNVAQAIEQ